MVEEKTTTKFINTSGFSFFGVLTLIFITLKLCGVIAMDDYYDKGNAEAIINEGIHVYKTKKEAKRLLCDDCCIVPILAYRKDLLGADGTEMVFKKIYISKTAFRKGVREAKSYSC